MIALDLARFQFATTNIFHFVFVPFTVGMALTVAILQTFHFVTGKKVYERLTLFFGHLFLINFAVGVVTGIVQEFQFGLNWKEFSTFVGNIFGVPLALEVLMAFFLESTFIGLWWFGRDRLPAWASLGSIWLVAIASSLSAFWIIVANAWMQHPVGYEIRDGQAVLTSFSAMLFSHKAWLWFWHVWFGAVCIAAFFVLGVSAFHLRRAHEEEAFGRTLKLGLVLASVGVVGVIAVGHTQGQAAVEDQPMKFAAMSALWESTSGSTPESIVALPSNREQRNLFSLEVPYLGSFLAYNSLYGGVPGLLELQDEYEARYGPGNYIPPVWPVYWSFRLMVGLGLLMFAVTAWGVWLWWRGALRQSYFFLGLLPFLIPVPHFANFFGWIVTEMGRQPWLVQGEMLTAEGVSPHAPGVVLLSLIAFWVVYLLLISLNVFLLAKTARAGFHEPEAQATLLPAPNYGDA